MWNIIQVHLESINDAMAINLHINCNKCIQEQHLDSLVYIKDKNQLQLRYCQSHVAPLRALFDMQILKRYCNFYCNYDATWNNIKPHHLYHRKRPTKKKNILVNIPPIKIL